MPGSNPDPLRGKSVLMLSYHSYLDELKDFTSSKDLCFFACILWENPGNLKNCVLEGRSKYPKHQDLCIYYTSGPSRLYNYRLQLPFFLTDISGENVQFCILVLMIDRLLHTIEEG